MLGPLDIHQYLLEHGVHHEIVRLPRPAANAEHLAEVLEVTPRRCLAIHPFHALTPDGDALVLVLAPADEDPSAATLISALRDLLHDRLTPDAELSVAGAALVSRRTDYIAGHLAPLLLPADVIVVSTQGVLDLATSIIYTATGDGGTALGIGATDLLNLTQAIVLCSDGPADRDASAASGYDVGAVDHIDLDPMPATPLPSTPIIIPLPNEAVLDDFERPVGAVTAARVRARTPLVVPATQAVAASAPPTVPAAPAVAATAS
jgi:prolyl-tRNA editing enzyme YbaK/EbsC (Cys-tRNA(Pro) deacylase)